MKYACPLCGAEHDSYEKLYKHMHRSLRRLVEWGVVKEELAPRSSRRAPRLFTVNGERSCGTLETLLLVKKHYSELSCSQLLHRRRSAPPLLGDGDEMRGKVVAALKAFLEKQRGSEARVKPRRLLRILYGEEGRACRQVSFNDVKKTVSILKTLEELDGWRLASREYKGGWVFTYVKTARGGGSWMEEEWLDEEEEWDEEVEDELEWEMECESDLESDQCD